MPKRNPIKILTQNQQIKQLSQQLITANNRITSLKKQLKEVDEAVFECIQRTDLICLGRVTDAVMDRCRGYSAVISDRVVGDLAPATTKRKARHVPSGKR